MLKCKFIASTPIFEKQKHFHNIHILYRLTESGLTQGLHKTKAINRTIPTTTILDGNDDEKETLITNKESSHEYD